MKEHVIREIRAEEIPLLDDFLYEAIFIPEGVPAPPRSIFLFIEKGYIFLLLNRTI